jgi:hypothetical protein
LRVPFRRFIAPSRYLYDIWECTQPDLLARQIYADDERRRSEQRKEELEKSDVEAFSSGSGGMSWS